MINLLPPTTKEQIRYAKLNRVIVGYLWLTVLVILVLGGLFGGAYYLISQQYASISNDVATKESQLSSEKRSVLPQAQDASQRLTAIAYVQDTQTHFSQVIADLADLFPVGVHLQGITLNGNDKAPVNITVTSDSYDNVLALRNSLATSPRLSGVDIVNIGSSGGIWTGTLVIAFKPGEAN